MIRNLCLRWMAPLALVAGLCAPNAHAAEIKLPRHPDYHNGKVVFSYLGDIWTVNEDGTNPKRLTVHRARDVYPRFSPDGKFIAFSSDRFGNNDVFVMPADGGTAKQLTFHSAGDTVVGWSRDSKKVVFQSSRGMLYPGIPNLYEVPVAGGIEQPILTDWGYWGSYSPDGQKFAFNRHPAVWWRKHYRGSYSADLWVLDMGSHKFRRLVDDKTPDEEKANNFWPMYGQGGDIYFVSDRETKAKSGTPEVYKSVNNIWKVNDSTGNLTQVTHHTSGALFFPSMSSDGKVIVYEESFGLCKLDCATGKTTPIKIDITVDDQDNNLETLTFNGECDSYYLSPSGKRAVISIHGELFTVATDKGEVRRITQTSNAREMQPTWSPDGKWIAYVCDKDGYEHIFLCDEKGGKMKQITTGDTLKNQLRWSPDASALIYTASDNKLYKYTVADGKTMAVLSGETVGGEGTIGNPRFSPDGKWISFNQSGKNMLAHVYVVPAAGGEAKRVTSPGTFMDTGAMWTPDGKNLVYIASNDVGTGPLSPNNKIAYQLFVVPLMPQDKDGGDKGIDSEEEAVKKIGGGKKGGGALPNLGPKFGGKGLDPNELFDMMAKGGEAVVIASSGMMRPMLEEWAKENGVTNGMITRAEFNRLLPTLMKAPLNAAQGEVEVKIDFNKIGRRARPLTKVGDNVGAAAITPDGKTVVFVTAGVEGGGNVQSIWAINIDGGTATRVVQSAQQNQEGAAPPPGKKGGGGGGGGGFSALQFPKEGRTLFYKQGKSIYSVNVGGGGGQDAPATAKGAAQGGGATGKKVNFVAKVEIDHRLQRQQVFLEAWRVMRHRFYDDKMHGADWAKVREMYEPLLAHVADTEELHNVICHMLGELNASHTGVSGGGKAGGPASATMHPGFDMEPDKTGYYKVTHVYKNGPCDKDFVKLNVGDYILTFNDEPLKSGDNYWKMFTRASTNRFAFMVNSKPAMDGAWMVKITPIAAGQVGNLQYEKWVDERRATVDRLSGGNIGYLHIRQMDEKALRQFERDLATLSTKKALIIDQRFNPGGNIDQELLNILQQKQYQITRQRGSGEVTRPLRAFFGPMVVMANERSTSDAEVFPDGFKTLKLGKVVGMTTYGAVIGTGSFTLMDGSSLRTPGSGLWNVNRTNLENNGVVPDVYVDNTPEDFFSRRDAQLEKAVQVLQQELQTKK